MLIDSSLKGNEARFISSSHNPNSVFYTGNKNGYKIITVYAKNKIKKNDEITVNYNFTLKEILEKGNF